MSTQTIPRLPARGHHHSARDGNTPEQLTGEVLMYADLVARLQLGKRTIERMVSKDEIPHKKIGKFVRFYWPEIEDWLRNQKGAKRR